MAAAYPSLCSSLTPKIHWNQASRSCPRNNLCFISSSLSSLTLASGRQSPTSFIAKSASTGDAAEVDAIETEVGQDLGTETGPEDENTELDISPSVESTEPKREEVFAVVMVGSRQYIVFPGRYIYTQRLKGASVNDKVTLNKVLLVGTKTSTYVGKPIVPNAKVQAIVEAQTLDKKVIVFKYKKKKHYRRNIGHRQPITKIRITSITGYQDYPAVTLDELDVQIGRKADDLL